VKKSYFAKLKNVQIATLKEIERLLLQDASEYRKLKNDYDRLTVAFGEH
jgi:hypothetical protein